MKYLAFTIHYSTAHFVVSEQLYLALDFLSMALLTINMPYMAGDCIILLILERCKLEIKETYIYRVQFALFHVLV